MDGAEPAADDAATLRLAQLMTVRLCHDLSGPLGGLCAALDEAPDDPAALPMAVEAALTLRRRVALLRSAWGEEPAPQSLAGLQELAAGLPNAARLNLFLDGFDPGASFLPETGRLLLNVILLAAESLHGSGSVAVAGGAAGQVLVTIAGKRAAWPVGFGAMLASAREAWGAITAVEGIAALRGLQAPFTALLVHRMNARAALLMAAATEQAPPLLA